MDERGRLGCQIVMGGVVLVVLFALFGGAGLWMQVDPEGAVEEMPVVFGEDAGQTEVEMAEMWGGMLRCAIPLGLFVAVICFFAGMRSG